MIWWKFISGIKINNFGPPQVVKNLLFWWKFSNMMKFRTLKKNCNEMKIYQCIINSLRVVKNNQTDENLPHWWRYWTVMLCTTSMTLGVFIDLINFTRSDCILAILTSSWMSCWVKYKKKMAHPILSWSWWWTWQETWWQL